MNSNEILARIVGAKRYHIYYDQYNIVANDYVSWIKAVETTDIYHEIGKLVCTSLCSIKNIRYAQANGSREDYESLFTEAGYRPVSGRNDWVLDSKKAEVNAG